MLGAIPIPSNKGAMKNFLDDQNASYDKLAKRFLARKSILA